MEKILNYLAVSKIYSEIHWCDLVSHTRRNVAVKV